MLTTKDKIEAVRIAAGTINDQDRVTIVLITSTVKEILKQTEAGNT